MRKFFGWGIISLVIYFLIVLNLSSCAGRVKWIEREGGDPPSKVFVPVCPSCEEVVNFQSRRCINPECRKLLIWKDKAQFADESDTPQD